MTDFMTVLINVIGGVESGGQVYGQRKYSAYADPYQNSPKEHTITLGWAQNYGSNARELVRRIFQKDSSTFRSIDKTGAIEAMLPKDWVAIRWSPSYAEKQILIKLIDTPAGHSVQDAMFAEQMDAIITDCERDYTTDPKAIIMYCEIRHLGGKSAVDRIFGRLGGDYSLDAILASLVKDQKDTSSDNQVGDKKYWSRHLKCRQFIDQYVVNEDQKGEDTVSIHYISNSGGDERGSAHGGQAGDQTGGEWLLKPWYNRPWSCVLRHPDAKVRELLADLGTKAAKNDKIGYDQWQRDTYWQQLQKAGYDPSRITVPCEADCSAGVIANTRAAGYLLGIDKLKNVNATYTGNMRSGFSAAGFTILTDSKYLNSPDYLLPGDILLNDEHHTATNITMGSKASGEVPEQKKEITAKKPADKFDKTIAGTYIAVKDVNMRDGAGSNLYPAIAKIPKGTKARCYGYYSLNRTAKWLYVQVTIDGVKCTGFVSSGLLKKI